MGTKGNNILIKNTRNILRKLEPHKRWRLLWLTKTQKRGTIIDKIGAATILIQESAMSNLYSLDVLLNIISDKLYKKSIVKMVVISLQELFSYFLLPDRKLNSLEENEQSLRIINTSDNGRLIFLYIFFEDCVKRRYARFVKMLEELSLNSITYIKTKCLKIAYILLVRKPEKRLNLVDIIVNKLGDPCKKTSSKAIYLILCLFIEYPKMGFIAANVMNFFFDRPLLKYRAIHNVVLLLNSMIKLYDKRDVKSMFIFISTNLKILKKVIDIDRTGIRSRNKLNDIKNLNPRKGNSKIIILSLTIIIKVLSKTNNLFFKQQIHQHNQCFFHLVHAYKSPKIAVKALIILTKLQSSYTKIKEKYRFYLALYSILTHKYFLRYKYNTTFSILFKAIEFTAPSWMVLAFIKQMFEIALEELTETAFQIMTLILKLMQNHGSIWLNFLIKDLRVHRSSKKLLSITENKLINENVILMANKLISLSTSKRTYKYDKKNKKLTWELKLMKRHVDPSVSMLAKNFLIGDHSKLEENSKYISIRTFFAVTQRLTKKKLSDMSSYSFKISRKEINISTFYHIVKSYDFFHHMKALF